MVNRIDSEWLETVLLICLNDIKRDQNGTLCTVYEWEREWGRERDVRIPIVTYFLNDIESTNGSWFHFECHLNQKSVPIISITWNLESKYWP